ncbi:MAG TPA: LLM class flavin-dependent oxidoreductase, partial [Blastocatellia bacterium]|nr:LLM class flavin-dependent oxidoreductase [Blastocatellia bacterium]
MDLRFHWRLPPGGERPDVLLPGSTDLPKVGLPDLAARVEFCRRAEEMGIDSVLTAFAANMPDPMLVAAALAPETEKIRFIVAYRPGLMSPVLFVQQVNTLSTLADGRVSLNIVIGHSQKEQAGYGDFLTHDERYERAGEFLAICNALWNGGPPFTFEGKHYRVEDARLNTPFSSERLSRPEIFLGGGSPQAQALASRQASCWLLLGESPKALGSRMKSAREEGIEVGLRFSIIARPTRSEALEAAASLINGADTQWVRKWFVDGNDSSSIKALFAEESGSDWLTPC